MSSSQQRISPRKQVRFASDDATNLEAFSPPHDNRLSFSSGSSGSPPVSLPSLSPSTPETMRLISIVNPGVNPARSSDISLPPTPLLGNIPLPTSTPTPTSIPLPPSPEQNTI